MSYRLIFIAVTLMVFCISCSTMQKPEQKTGYSGDLVDGKKNGKGTYVYSDGEWYAGEWKDDKWHGKGKFYRANGDVYYDGEWNEGNKHGKGTYIYSDGSRYKGLWKDDKRHGKGKYYTSKGDLYYEGDWEDDYKTGNGVCYYLNGDKYTGGFVRDSRHGQGIIEFTDGLKYEGTWSYGEIESDICLKGECQNGTGILLLKCGDRLEGMFKKSKIEGEGLRYNSEGELDYKGEFRNGMRTGNPQLSYIYFRYSRVRYSGIWKNDKPKGRGRLTN